MRRSLDNDETRVINNGSAVGRARYRERFGTIGTSRGSNALNGVVKKARSFRFNAADAIKARERRSGVVGCRAHCITENITRSLDGGIPMENLCSDGSNLVAKHGG